MMSSQNVNIALADFVAQKFIPRLVESIPDGLVLLDENGRVILVNPGAERILVCNREDTLMKPVEQLLTVAGETGSIRNLLSPGEKARSIPVINAHGQEIMLSITCAFIEQDDGKAAGMLLVFRDATDENAAERLRSYFLANISHEFRTPLSALKASVEILLEEIEDLSKAETIELLKSLHFSVTALQTLIDNLLESVSMEAGQFHIRRRSTDLMGVIKDAGKIMQPLLERRHQELILQVPDDLPRADVDPMRLNQVLVNLVSNASKYGPMGKPIKLTLTRESLEMVRIAVIDQGPGIAAEDRVNIFRRFIRLDQEKDKVQFGVGLGLSVVKTIVESHGGQVGLDAAYGGGNEFWFNLPLGRWMDEGIGRR